MKRNRKIEETFVLGIGDRARLFSLLFILVVMVLSSAFTLTAQESNGGGTYPEKRESGNTSDKNLRSLAKVNPSTLALEMTLPLMSYPGRNGNSLSVDFRYSSKVWRFKDVNTWFTGNGANRFYITDVFALYGERSAAGWTSSLVPPRIDEEQIIYSGGGHPYTASVGEGENFTWIFAQALQSPNFILTWICPTTPCHWGYLKLDEPVREPAWVPEGGDPNIIYYVKRWRVVMPDGSSHEFRQNDESNIQVAGTFQTSQPTDLNGTFLAVDGSGLTLTHDTSGFVLRTPNGGYYDFPSEAQNEDGLFATSFTDVNGNRLTYHESPNSPGHEQIWTDSLGRQISDPIPHNWLTQTQQRGNQTVNLPGLNGTSQQYQLTWDNLKPRGCEDIIGNSNCVGQNNAVGGALENQSEALYFSAPYKCFSNLPETVGTGVLFPMGAQGVRPCNEFTTQSQNGVNVAVPVRFNPVVLTRIALPNGQYYEFKYNRYGEMSKITYPTGSIETFVYDVIPESSGYSTLAHSQTNRGVVEHKLYEAGATAPLQKWTYTPSVPTGVAPNGVNAITTKQFTSDNLTTPKMTSISFFHEGYNIPFGYSAPKAGMPFDERTYDENGALRSRVLTDYATKHVVPHDPTTGSSLGLTVYRDLRVTRKVSIMFEPGSPMALATLSETCYDEYNPSPGRCHNPNNAGLNESFFPQLNVRSQKSYHYVSVDALSVDDDQLSWTTMAGWFAGKTPASITETDYAYDDNYKANGIPSLPIETRVLNPQNPSEVLAVSQVLYDEQGQVYSMADYGATTGYQAPTGTNTQLRGNPTTKRTLNNDTNTWIETHTQFDNFGNVRKVWDTSGDMSRFLEYEYDPFYKYAYVTKTKAPAPDPSGVHGMTQGSEITHTFDFTTGLPLTVTDANGQTATTQYDAMLRPIRVIPPVGGAISETEYNDTERWVKSRQQIDGTNWAEKTTYFDTLGRPFKSKTKDAQGDVFSEIKYDNLGRVEKLSNPYRQGETIFWSKPRYDSVGRVVETFAPEPDGQTGASLGTVQFGISTENNLVGAYTVATDASGRKSRVISGIYGIMRVDEATGIGGTVDQDLGTVTNPNQPTSYSYNIKGELIKITQGKAGQSGQPYQNRYFKYDSLGRLIRVRQPEQTPNSALATTGNPDNNSWTAGFTYDVFGNVVTMTDAKNTTITNEYDKASRPTKRMYSDGTTPPVEYFYDGKGLPAVPQFSRGAITKVTNGISEDRFTSFDNHGRLLASQQITDNQTYLFGYKYNLSGGLIEETYPSLRTVKNTLNSDGGLNTVKTKAVGGLTRQVVSNIDYSASGDVRKMRLGNGLWETSVVSERLQLMQIGLGTTETNNDLFKVEYDYGELSDDGNSVDANRNIGMIARTTTTIPTLTSTTSFTQTFKYDAINRLKEAKEKSGAQTNWQQTFGYDIFGNRTSFSQTVNGVQLPINNLTLPNIDPTNNRFTTGQGYVYDYNGNLIQDAEGRHFTFDGNDKQTEVRNANNELVGQYFYDASGARVKKVVPSTGETTVFVYDAGGSLAAEYSTVQETSNPTTSYLTTDHLGSPRVITDQNQNVTSRRDFMPFGEEIGVGVGGRTAAMKYSAAGSDKIRKRYTGYEKDPETELDFAEARMYQNKHGRFTAVDPLMSSASALNPQTFNRYTYTGNNPVNFNDPSGLTWCNVGGTISWNGQKGLPCAEGKSVDGKTLRMGGSQVTTEDSNGNQIVKGSRVTFYEDGRLIAVQTSAQRQGQTVSSGSEHAAEQTAGESAASSAGSGGASPHGSASGTSSVGSSSGSGNTGMLSLCAPGMECLPNKDPVVIDLVQGATAEELLDFSQLVLDLVATSEFPLASQGAGALNMGIDAFKGDWTSVGFGAAGLLPGGAAADAAKIARRLNKAVNAGSDVAKAVNGNSKLSTVAQHGYEVFEVATGNVVKTGVSGGPISQAGKSYRATSQISKLNKSNPGAYDSRIVKTIPAGPGARANILEWEKANANRLRAEGQLRDSSRHRRP